MLNKAKLEYKKFLIKLLQSKSDFKIIDFNDGSFKISYKPSLQSNMNEIRVRFAIGKKFLFKYLFITLEDFNNRYNLIIINKLFILCQSKHNKKLLKEVKNTLNTIYKLEYNDLINTMPEKYNRLLKLNKFLNNDN